MKCTVCREPAVIDLRRHNSNFCSDHFLKFCRDQVIRAISDYDMIGPGDSVLVAVSGGKDSLAIWDILGSLGYDVDGLYVGLGIGDYSDSSGEYVRNFVESRGLNLIEIDLRDTYGFDVPQGARAARRAPCSACGLTKRHVFDRAAVDGGYDVLVTGHNLDDEAAVLFGNTIKWQTEYLGRQAPVLPARGGFPKKVKPLVRLSEREMAAYCVLAGIDYIVDECPMAAGNRHLGHKEILNQMEARSPGAKADFYFNFLRSGAAHFRTEDGPGEDGVPAAPGAPGALGTCERCGAPASGEVCAFCRLLERAGGSQPSEAQAVTLGPRRGGST